MSNKNKKYNYKLIFFRKARGLTIVDAAEKIGVTAGFLSQIEGGISEPSLNTAKKLADLYDTTIDNLFYDNEFEEDFLDRALKK